MNQHDWEVLLIKWSKYCIANQDTNKLLEQLIAERTFHPDWEFPLVVKHKLIIGIEYRILGKQYFGEIVRRAIYHNVLVIDELSPMVKDAYVRWKLRGSQVLDQEIW